jgi:membrane protein DedA with SNARE-associated domain
VLNALAALLWSILVIGAGYLFGEAAAAMLDRVEGIEKQLLAIGGLLAFAAIASILLRRWLMAKLK